MRNTSSVQLKYDINYSLCHLPHNPKLKTSIQNLEDVRCCLDPHGILVLKAFITRDRWEAERQAEKKVPRAVIYSTRHLPKISQQLSG